MDVQLRRKADRRQRADRYPNPPGGRRSTDPEFTSAVSQASASDAARRQHHAVPQRLATAGVAVADLE